MNNNFKKGGFPQRNDSFDGRPPKFDNKFGGKREGGDRQERQREMFPAVCAECGKKCEVPFRPTGDKPVYCRDCFGKQPHVPGRNSNGADGPRPPSFRRDDRHDRDRRPDYPRSQNNEAIESLKRKIDSLEVKVTRILELVSKRPDTVALGESLAKFIPQETAKASEKKKAPAKKAAKKGKK